MNAPLQPRRPVESGVPDPFPFMHPIMKKNYGQWAWHDRMRPGVLHHVAKSGDEIWTVRAGTQRQMDVFTVRKLCDIADQFAEGYVRFTTRSNIEFMLSSKDKVEPLVAKLTAEGFPVGGTGNSVSMISHTQGWLHCDIPGTDASGVVKSLMDMMYDEFVKEEMPNRVRITTSCCQINCGGQGDISINVQYTKPPKINHDLVSKVCERPKFLYPCNRDERYSGANEMRVTSGAKTACATAETVGDIGVITLSNQAKRNALSHDMMRALMEAFVRFKETKVRVVVLRAEPGVKVWSAGHDVGELPLGDSDPLCYEDPMEGALRAIRMFPGPVIAMVHGSVWGGAVDLVLSCDMVFADETATFAITAVNIGLPYNTTGLLHFMGRLRLNIVKELFFTATPIDAERALKWGIINHLVPSPELETFSMEAARWMAAKAPLAMAVIKEQLRVLSDYQPIPAQVFERIQDMRRKVYESADYREGIAAFKEKRKPIFRGN